MKPNLLFMSTSAFLQTMLANRLPIPLIEVRANIIFCLPSTFVFSTRRMCWKSSFATTDCNQDHIKSSILQTQKKKKKKKQLLKLQKEKNASFKDGNDTIFFAEALDLCRLGICTIGFRSSVPPLLSLLFTLNFIH